MRKQLVVATIVVVAASMLAGCTLSHVTAVHTNFEPGTSISIKCKEYKKLVELTQGVREMEKYGWKTATVGYKHTYVMWGFALKSRMWVCFEKPAEGEETGPAEEPAQSDGGVE